LARRAASGNEWTAAPQPDPRKAILEFRDQLKERDIILILVPAPTKPGVHPERLSGRYRDYNERPLHNVSYESFTRELRNENVLICELDYVLKQEGTPGYLATDTHWRPKTVVAVAKHLADFVKEHVAFPEPSESGYKQILKSVTNHGDIKYMMKLPEGQTTFEPETVNIKQVVNTANEFWRPSASADVLLLGDSFSNIYSLASMRWGNSAGLAEQLSFYLQRPLDVIIRNDEGAHATRGALSRNLARGKDRLAGKRVVIWEFAERELALGNWKHLPMELNPDPEPSKFVVPAEGTEMIVTGVVEAVSGIPNPGSVVYPDHIFSVHLSQLRDHQGQDIPGGEAVVYLYSMQAHTPTTASQLLRPGREAKLKLLNWIDVEATYGSIRRSELDNEDLLFEDPCWGELLTQGAEQ
jgi:alginate O-acetyltransferase complex protein AlgJ